MSLPIHRCAVCPETAGLTGVVVAGTELLLCEKHLAKLGNASPASFDDLAVFFATLGSDRRQESDRRDEDRRVFPPRPELRRYNMGRRKDDPEV
ncbi:MAG: hypothetical protein JRI68_05075 [Deltaproteobacteria bacterium]|nr:hypothetical protein [Deltaproteobacteria bacterium]